MFLLSLTLFASAADPPDLRAALAKVAEHRAQRQASAPPTIPDDAYDKVARGDTVTGLTQGPSGSKAAWGAVLVDAPIGRVWSAVNDFSSRTDYSKVAFSEVQQGAHCGSGRQVFQYLPVGFPVSDRWWVSTLTINRALWQASGGRMRELWFQASTDPGLLRTEQAKAKAAEGVPVGKSEGGWLVIDAGAGRTLIEYFAYSEPGGSVPTSFANAFATGGVKGTLQAVAKLAHADPRCPED